MPNGEIIIHFANGDKFKGMFRNGKRNGKAIEETKEGVRFEGSYKDDERDGAFIEKDRNGKIISKGIYEEGLRQQD